MAARLEEIADRIARLDDRAIVAIDGVDGSGKTTFADMLAPVIASRGRSVLRASIDGFHNPRAVRYRLGRADPEGFFRDSYDYGSLRRHLIDPFRNGAAEVEVARFDHRTDREVVTAQRAVGPSALLLDGIFVHRDELCDLWDFSIFLVVPFTVTFARMAKRDGCDPDPSAPQNRRYHEGQTIYLKTCRPERRATVVIDNSYDKTAPYD